MSASALFAHFGATQQAELPYARGAGQILCSLSKGCPAGLPPMLQSPSSIETRASWAVATVALVTMLMAFGAAWITAVALKDIAAEVDGVRAVPALASALAWLGSGIRGIMMGRIADRIRARWTLILGAPLIGLGLPVSPLGPPPPLWVGHW